MGGERRVIVLVLLGVIISLLLLYFVFIGVPGFGGGNTGQETQQFSLGEEEFPTPRIPSITQAQQNKGGEQVQSVFVEGEEVLSGLPPELKGGAQSFLDAIRSYPNDEGSSLENVPSSETIGGTEEQGQQQSEENPITFSEREILAEILTPRGLEDAEAFQDRLIGAGHVAESEKATPIDSLDDFFIIQNQILDYVGQEAGYDRETIQKGRKGLNIFREELEIKRAAVIKEKTGADTSLRNDIWERMFTWLGFFGEPLRVFRADTAYAHGEWVTAPDCYKALAPVNNVDGINTWAPCCNCGFLCVTDIEFGCFCGFIPDCGPFGAACNVHLGCLNGAGGVGACGVPNTPACGAWPNAIWDALWYPNGTGICGCG